jgi:hypothetical protein
MITLVFSATMDRKKLVFISFSNAPLASPVGAQYQSIGT